MINGKADLHIHTTHSDGSCSPEEIIIKAQKASFEIISITDHDNVKGFGEASKIGKDLGVEVIPGVELSSEISDREIHILGYFFDSENPELERYLSFFREERKKRAGRIVNKLRNLGFEITLDEVFEKAGKSSVGRPHIAQVMLERNMISSFYEAFNKYIGNGAPAYEKKIHVCPQSAFRIINEAGGLSFIAHPGNLPEILLKELIDSGVDGIEVIHPSHSKLQQKFYRGIVNSYFLLECGGSDYHGGKREDDSNFGQYFTSTSSVEAMRKRLMKHSA
jgi:predicted metal-dependent phosphoesterase TrpH